MKTRLSIALLLILLTAGCGSETAAPAPKVDDAERGRRLLQQFGCGSCHRIPGVAAATGNVGPSLEELGRRVYIAGHLPNTPDNLVRWIRDPTHVDPDTGMPDLQVGEAHARDMAAYLQELR